MRHRSASFATLGSSWRRTFLRTLWMGCSLLVLLYSVAVLTHVAWMGTIGVRCMFGTKVEEEIPADYEWQRPPCLEHWRLDLRRLDRRRCSTIHREKSYGDYIRALRSLSGQVGNTIEVQWRDQQTPESHTAKVLVQCPPSWTYYRSCVWFLQELLIFAIGARVFWKRPDDDSAQLFFAVCIVTVGAFMGGYHWTEIVAEPGLIYPFALFAVFVPVVNLHFFLVFPRPNPGSAAAQAAGSWALSTGSRRHTWWRSGGACWRPGGCRSPGGSQASAAFQVLRCLALGYIALAVFLFGMCIFCLVLSYRNARTRGERNQVRWILLASLIASVLIAYLLVQAWIDPATLGRGNAAWPMFGVSLLYTMAYAFSITRYKLMQVEDDHQSQRGLFRLQSDGRADLFGRAPGQRQVDRRPVVLDPFDLARGGCGGAVGDRGADSLRSGSRAGFSA